MARGFGAFFDRARAFGLGRLTGAPPTASAEGPGPPKRLPRAGLGTGSSRWQRRPPTVLALSLERHNRRVADPKCRTTPQPRYDGRARSSRQECLRGPRARSRLGGRVAAPEALPDGTAGTPAPRAAEQ